MEFATIRKSLPPSSRSAHAGHVHAYLRYRPLDLCPGGLTLIVSGGGGARLVPRLGPDPRLERAAVVHHHVRLWIEVEGMVIEAVDLGGKTFDRVTIGG